MADIELVIKIPESQYKTLNAKTQEDVVDIIDDKLLIDAIKNGTSLSKGHGRLIDADELFWDIQTDEQMRLGEHLAWVKERIDEASTIIEAESGNK